MAVSIAAMTLAELEAWLLANPIYLTVADAVEAGALVATEAAGLGGVAITVAGETAAAVDATITGATILDYAAAAELLAKGQKVTTSGLGLLQGSSGFKLSALLGVKVGPVASAIAPLYGISLGANLYKSNPTLWTKISQKLLPFCYPGTDTIPTWAEIGASATDPNAWTTYIPKKICEALRSLFEEEEIPIAGASSSGNASSDLNISPASYPIPFTDTFTYRYQKTDTGELVYGETLSGAFFTSFDLPETPRAVTVIIGSSVNEFFITSLTTGSTSKSSMSSTFTHNGKTVYYRSIQYKSGFGPVVGDFPSMGAFSSVPISNVAWSMVYGDISSAGEYPAGTSEWQGTTPSTIPLGKPAVVSTDGTAEDTVPISIPIEITPGESNPELDPELQPDPTETTDPSKQVEPYIMPSPVPWEIYAPDTGEETETDPTLDPTTPRPPTDVITNPPVSLSPDPIGISPWPTMPGTPLAFAQNVGLITVYHPTPAQLYAFESWLWVTLQAADINTVWNNPFDGVIGLFELYCTPTDVGNRTIHSGFLDSGINSAIISRYTEINCGTLAIPEYYGNYFDYSPYSKAHVYLPFIGVQELNVDDIVGHVVNITYRIDEYNGSCIAMITVAKSTEVNGEQVEYRNTMYQFSGNCAVDLPIAGGSQASIKAGMMTANAYQQAGQISALGQLTGGLMSMLGGLMGVPGFSMGGAVSGLTGALSTAAYGQANALSHMLSGKSTVQKSGQFGSSHGAMGIKNPFITITRPKQIQVPNYNDLYGYPAHKMVTIGACTGFLRCREVHVVSARANDEEKGAIEAMLKSGVYVTE